jgi:hypothetical protein
MRGGAKGSGRVPWRSTGRLDPFDFLLRIASPIESRESLPLDFFFPTTWGWLMRTAGDMTQPRSGAGRRMRCRASVQRFRRCYGITGPPARDGCAGSCGTVGTEGGMLKGIKDPPMCVPWLSDTASARRPVCNLYCCIAEMLRRGMNWPQRTRGSAVTTAPGAGSLSSRRAGMPYRAPIRPSTKCF